MNPPIDHPEQPSEKMRGTVGFLLGPLVFVTLLFTPMQGVSAEAQRLAAIMGLVIVFWLTEPIPIPVTAVLGPLLCILLGVATAKEVLPNFGHPLILFFLGGFILAKGMQIHGVSRRFALTILSQDKISRSPYRVMFAVGAVTAILSMWISNTATAAIMYPISIGVLGALSYGNSPITGEPSAAKLTRSPFGLGMMLIVAYSATIGGMATPIGSPPNLIAIAALDELVYVKISFLQWMILVLPISMLLYGILYLYLSRVCPAEDQSTNSIPLYVAKERQKLGHWTRAQVNTLIAFGVTVIMWVLPGIIALIYGTHSDIFLWFDKHLPEPAAALTGAIVLFILPVDWENRKFTIELKQALAIDWGTLLLFGGGLALGEQMFATGLAKTVGTGLVKLTGANTLFFITALSVAIAILMTETTSNTASANMVVPVVIAIAVAANINPVPPALGAALGANMGFLLPISTPPNAIVYSSGLVPITKMVRYGIVMSIICFIVVTLVAYYVVPRFEF